MGKKKIVLCARIEEVKYAARKERIERDHDSEKRVLEELRAQLKKEGIYDSIKHTEFQRRYKKKLKDFAAYIGGHYVERDGSDGNPGLLVSKKVWENEIKISYTVGEKRYTKTLTHCTKTKELKRGDNLFITVDPTEPKNILRQSTHDYRAKQENSDNAGCGYVMFFIVAIVLMYIAHLLNLY